MCLSYCSLEYYQSSMRIQEKSPPYYVIFCRVFLSTPSLSSTPILLRKESLAPENDVGEGGCWCPSSPPLPPVSTALYIPTLFVLVSQTPISINKPMIEINLFLFYLT